MHVSVKSSEANCIEIGSSTESESCDDQALDQSSDHKQLGV